LCRFLGIAGQALPHYTTVDDALASVDYEDLNQILLSMFEQLNTRKFFYNHSATLLPDGLYYIGTDGCHLHTYTHPHTVDEHGHNTCLHCLPRKRHAGTDKEETYWVHIVITFVLICDGLTIPLYIYPLKANQVNTDQSDDKLKQECELQAARTILPKIKQRFPKLNFSFLGDGLYANRPFMRFCDALGIEYNIVRKEKSLPSIGRKCDELAKLPLYQKSYTHQEKETIGGTTTTRKAQWFNKVDCGDDLGDLTTNVLKFEDTAIDANGKELSRYKGEWLCSKKLSENNCMRQAKRGRMRWGQEDFHNTCKNRGFVLKHDMARANPNLLFVWKLMACIAFFVSELFNLSTIAIKARGVRSLMKFARDMLYELLHIAWEKISASPILRKPKVQFRYQFKRST
jgi:hypothetical protein